MKKEPMTNVMRAKGEKEEKEKDCKRSSHVTHVRKRL